jgi:hypothetical protein
VCGEFGAGGVGAGRRGVATKHARAHFAVRRAFLCALNLSILDSFWLALGIPANTGEKDPISDPVHKGSGSNIFVDWKNRIVIRFIVLRSRRAPVGAKPRSRS